MLTRDELIQKLMDDYAPEDKVLGWVWGWDSVLEFFDDFPEGISSLPISKEEFARQVWEKCHVEVDEVVSYVMNGYSVEPIDQTIFDAVRNSLES